MAYMTPGRSGVTTDNREAAHAVPPKMRGLGDLLARVFKKFGIELIVRKVSKGKDCGCKKRQEMLNKAVPFGGNDELRTDED